MKNKRPSEAVSKSLSIMFIKHCLNKDLVNFRQKGAQHKLPAFSQTDSFNDQRTVPFN